MSQRPALRLWHEASSSQSLRIGCSSAFWGDSSTAAAQLLHHGNLDVLVADYLAEVTMGLLARMKTRGKSSGGMGEGGYVSEFVHGVMKPLFRSIVDQGVCVVTNAGGMNPIACKQALEELAFQLDINPPPVIAAVVGDDLMPRASELKQNHQLFPFDVLGEE